MWEQSVRRCIASPSKKKKKKKKKNISKEIKLIWNQVDQKTEIYNPGDQG